MRRAALGREPRAGAPGRRGRLAGEVLRSPGGRTPAGYLELDWQRGALVRRLLRHALRPERLDQVRAALPEPAGPIHWAGAETSSVWCGYMDGAVRSGERAAAAVLAELG